jgi:ACT domain-containing protein
VLAVDISAAAQMVGLSRAQFYKLYLDPKRVCSIQTGKRDRVIDVGELRAAYEALRDELPRSGTARRRS